MALRTPLVAMDHCVRSGRDRRHGRGSGAFALASALVGEPEGVAPAALTWGILVGGGLVEGFAIGVAQWWVLRDWLVALPARSWVGVTMAAAAVGWAVGALPAVVRNSTGGDAAGVDGGPPLWVMPVIGVIAGLVLGAMFGAAQYVVLRRFVANAGLWMLANALGWAAAMAVMFTGASIPSTTWPTVDVLFVAAVTGVLAGLAIGAITGLFLPTLKLVNAG